MKIFVLVLFTAGFFSGSLAFAEGSESPYYVDQNQGCFAAKQYPCALRALQGSFRIERAEQIYVLEAGSSVVLKSENEIQLLEGQLWIEKSTELSLGINPYFKPKVSGEFWLKKEQDRTYISNLHGKFEQVPLGFENWYGGISVDNKVESGIIQPIAFEAFASNWAQHFSGPKIEKLTRLKAYRDQWKESLSQGTEFYAKVIERSMASVENKDRKAQNLQMSREQERKSLKQLFRSKNYLDPDAL